MDSSSVIPHVLAQHCEDLAFLWALRERYLERGDIGVDDLVNIDERIEAHLDGVRVCGERGRRACHEALADASNGVVFAAATLALESRSTRAFQNLLALVEAEPSLATALIGALGRASPQDLQGVVKSLLGARSALHVRIGIAACAAHGVHPGALLRRACEHADCDLAAQALRTAGELGQTDLIPVCLAQISDGDAQRAMWAAWSAVLLGDRVQALETIAKLAGVPALHSRALHLALKALDLARGRDLLKALWRKPGNVRLAIRGAGMLGDVHSMPWLIRRMEELSNARLAGEAFSLITGVCLKRSRLSQPAPQAWVIGPTNDPADDNVEMDEDEGLPWPDPSKVASWWRDRGSQYTSGVRLFMGQAPSPASSLQVLKTGHQRERLAAAEHWCLQVPGSALFDATAPAWRQMRLLTQLEGAS